MNQVIDFSTLTWVKNELDATLKEARHSLEAHVENPQDEAEPGFLVAHLHQVFGTLQMVELYGASLLVEEMKAVAKGIQNKSIGQHDDACEVLMRAMLQLPDYLDRLISGHRDIPLVLLPLLNDLRAVRGESFLSESAMFSPCINVNLPAVSGNNSVDGDLGNVARELRHRYQLGLLGWFRDQNSDSSLKALSDVIEDLLSVTADERIARIWWAAAGMLDAIRGNALESSISVKRLLGQVDRQIKNIIDDGEENVASGLTDELIKNLLFYVGQVRGGGARVEQIKSTYRLQDLLPGEEELAAARDSMTGQNNDLFATVAIAVREELGRLKDMLDVVLRNERKQSSELAPLHGSLRALSDTLGMLGLGAARKAVLDKSDALQQCMEEEDTPADTLLMDVASTLLFVESSVERMDGYAVAGPGNNISNVNQHLADSEFGQVTDVVLKEAVVDLIRAKEAIVAFVDSGNDFEALAEVLQLFNQVKGGLSLLGETRAADLMTSIGQYVERELMQNRAEPPQHELDSLADAICGLEYYLEGRMENRMYSEKAMDVAEDSIQQLGYASNDVGEVETGECVAVEQMENESSDAVALTGDGESGTSSDGSDESLECAAMDQGEGIRSEYDEAEAEAEAEAEGEGDYVLQESQLDPGFSAMANILDTGIDERLDKSETEAGVPQSEEADLPDQSSNADPVLAESAEQLAVAGEDDGLAIIGSDTDEEILEIFLEEAEEEIDRINENLPLWIRDNDNPEALATIRRSYHTLKGSGRLVGAMRIGEFAWSFENLLNKIIDNTVNSDDVVYGLLQQASEVLPELVAQIQDGAATVKPIAYLARCADAVSKGEPLPEPVTRPVVGEAIVEHAETAPVSGQIDQEKIEFIDEDEPLDESTEVMDSTLYGIFSVETMGHLAVVREFLEFSGNGNTQVSEDLVRALHTIHGSAHMAHAEAIGDVSGHLERYARLLMNSKQIVDDIAWSVFADGVEFVETMLTNLPEEVVQPEGLGEFTRCLIAANEVLLADSKEQEIPEEEKGAITASYQEGAETPSDTQAAFDPVVPVDPYAEMDQELLEIFLEESHDNMEAIDAALHQWRQSFDDQESVAKLQRALHTLKGSARMADLPAIGDLAHAVESLIISISEGLSGATEDAHEGVRQAQDQMAGMLASVAARESLVPAEELIEKLDVLRNTRVEFKSECEAEDELSGDEDPVAESESDADDAALSAAVENMLMSGDLSADPYADVDEEILQVFLEEAGDILENSEQTLRNWKREPLNQALIAELQRELHTLKGGARMADISAIGDLAHHVESLMVSVSAGELKSDDTMFALLEQTHDRLVSMIDQVHNRKQVSEAADLLPLLENLREGKAVSAGDLAKKSEGIASSENTKPVSETQDRRSSSRSGQELVRIRTDLLDNLVNYAGEVSIYRSRLEQQIGAYRFNMVELDQTVSRVREQLRKMEIETEAQVLFSYEQESGESSADFDPLEMDRYSHMQQLSRSLVESVSDLGSIQGMLDNITRESETLLLQQSRVNTELQEGLMRTRMVPFLGLAARMRRIVRQTCQELGKKAELELSGAEGEMDRNVVDRIIAPIEHMLRNALSHGIEKPEDRQAAGKPSSGTISIVLERESSDVVLRIIDDGAGIDHKAIRRKAVERGLLEEDSTLSDNEILQFILETGFSTAEKVTQVAGRGVGMDVVNSEVKQLGGTLRIDSVAGQGTTFTIRLPFTLAVNQALLISVGDDLYAIPLSTIEGIVRMRREDLKAYYADPEKLFDYGGFQYQVHHLGSILGTGSSHLDGGPKRLPVMLVRTSGHCVALQVEDLLGSREIVVKSVGAQISTVRGVSGATILGDGRVVMILDVAALLRGGVGSGANLTDVVEKQMAQNDEITVMVVDDSITVRKVTTRLLERNEMNVVSAKDGVDAVARLQETLPDIMLLDIEMPRMDGFELATHIRNEPRLRDIPIIMITSRTGDKHRQRAMQIGVNRYLGKPFQESDLLENIRELLEEE